MDAHDLPADPVPADALLLVGRIGKPHGLRGEVKMVPETDDPERLEGLGTLFVGARAETAVARRVESIRFQPTKRGPLVVLKLEGFGRPEEAEALRNASVFALEADLPPLEEDEFYVHDLIGLDVVTPSGDPIGRVSDVLEVPAQLILVVERPGQAEALIPAVDEFLVEVDLEAGRVVVDPIEGLLE